MSLNTIIAICIASVDLVWNLVITFLVIFHWKKGHRIPDAQKIENMKKKKELKAAYKAGLKAIEGVKDEKKK